MDLREEAGRKELGRRIQTAVAQAGYSSLPAFAEDLGCSRALIYQYVSGAVLVQIDRLSAIAELTEKPLDWFVVDDPNGNAGEVEKLQQRVADLRQRSENLEAALAEARGEQIDAIRRARETLLEALQQLCRAQRQAGDMPGLIRSAARCVDIARSVDDRCAVMGAQLQAGHAACERGERDDAEEALQTALEMALELGDERVEMSARQELVRVWQSAGRLKEARQQAREIAESQRWWPQWSGLVAQAAIDEQQGDLAGAEALLDEAERVIATTDAPVEQVRMAEVYVQSNRVNVLLARGWYDEAAAAARSLQAMASEAGLPDQVREATLDRAIAAMRTGQFGVAEELLERLSESAEMSGDRRMKGLAKVFEAERLTRSGKAVQARPLALDAIEEGNGAVNGQIVAEAERVLGMACLADGLIEDADYHLERCRRRSERLRLRRVEVAARLQQARVMMASGDGGARAAFREVHEMAVRLNYTDLAGEAAGVLDSDSEPSAEQTGSGPGEDA